MGELKKKCSCCIIAFFIIFSLAYKYSDNIILFLTKCIVGSGANIITIAPLEMVYSKFYISSIVSIIIILPYVILTIYYYLKPALYDEEIRIVKKVLFPCSFTFLTGFILFMVCGSDYLIYFISSFSIDGIDNSVSLIKYIQFIVCCCSISGVICCYPIFIYLINAIGIINKNLLKRYRKHAIIIAFVVGALVTPPDIITQCLIAMPLIILHEISIRVI